MDISGWYLNDQSNATLNWKIPNGTIIPAKGYLIFWADGMDQKLHTNFKLSATGEEIILLDPSGNQMDLIQFSMQQTDVSYGRKTDGDAVLGFLIFLLQEALIIKEFSIPTLSNRFRFFNIRRLLYFQCYRKYSRSI